MIDDWYHQKGQQYGPSGVKRHLRNDPRPPVGVPGRLLSDRNNNNLDKDEERRRGWTSENIASVEGARRGLIDNGAVRTDASQ